MHRRPRPASGGRSETPPVASAAPSDAGTPEVAGNGKDRPSAGRPGTAKQALAALVAAEAAIADPATRPKELVRAARVQQLVYRELGARPAWDAAVLRRLPRALRSVVRDNVASRREFRAMHSVLADTLPAWRIVPPAPAEDLLRYYQRGERAFGIGWEYLAAINLVETGMGRIRGTSVAGAQGPMQFLPTTWASWGRGDIQDPADAIMAAARYLAHDGGARPSRLDDALFRYNNSDRLRPRRDPSGEGHGTAAACLLRLLPLGHLLPDRARRRRLPVGYEPRPTGAGRALAGHASAAISRAEPGHRSGVERCRVDLVGALDEELLARRDVGTHQQLEDLAASSASSTVSRRRVRRRGSMVVSASWSASISPSPL